MERQKNKKLMGYMFVLPWDLHHIGGVNQVVANLYDEMEQDSSLKPLVMVGDWEIGSPKEEIVGGRRLVRMRLRQPISNVNRMRSFCGYLFHAVPELLRISRYLTSRHIGVVNIHYPTLASIAFLVLKKLRLYRGLVFVSLHGLDIRQAIEKKGLERFIWQQILLDSDAIVTCSDGLKTDVLDFEDRLESKIHTVYNGIDVDKLAGEKDPKAKVPDELRGRRFLLNVGTFEHKKGHDILVRAYYKLKSNYSDLALVIIGRAGETIEQVRSYITEMNLENDVFIFYDMNHESVLAFYEQAELFVLPSRNEGFAVALLEAAAYKLPIVATNVCGVAELIIDKESGLLIASEDVNALSEAIAGLMEQDAYRESLGQAIYQQVRSRFTWRNSFEGYRDLAAALRLKT